MPNQSDGLFSSNIAKISAVLVIIAVVLFTLWAFAAKGTETHVPMSVTTNDLIPIIEGFNTLENTIKNIAIPDIVIEAISTTTVLDISSIINNEKKLADFRVENARLVGELKATLISLSLTEIKLNRAEEDVFILSTKLREALKMDCTLDTATSVAIRAATVLADRSGATDTIFFQVNLCAIDGISAITIQSEGK
tara:strand:+ start:4334 stop:4918 length:585 start_codon:yes stop_codon:yes gene_type:complete